MSVVKVVLRKTPKADGTCPIALRITKDRKATYIYLGYHVLESEWDAIKQRVRKTHPNSVRLNNMILKKLAETSDTAIELDTNRAHVSSKAVKLKVKPKGGTSFNSQAQLYLETLKSAGKYNQYTADKSRLKNFQEFNGADLAFSDITVSHLERFKHYCLYDLKLSERTAVNHWVTIRSIFSQAIRDEVTDARYYPFGKGKISIKFPSSAKIGLDIEDVKKIEKVTLTEDNQNYARDLWLLSFYFAGMRVSDLLRLKWSDIEGNRLYYTMGKNLKPLELKIDARALAILEKYKADKKGKDDFVFPALKELDKEDKFIIQRRIAHTASRIDKILRNHVAPAAKVTKRLTMHIARHTFANIAGDRISLDLLQRLFMHSTLLVTAGYMNNFKKDRIDNALETVLNFDNEAVNDNQKAKAKRIS